jgi:hypothetical protein
MMMDPRGIRVVYDVNRHRVRGEEYDIMARHGE